MVNDNLSDLLTRLRNATMAGKEALTMQPTKSVLAVAKILESEGYLSKVSAKDTLLELQLNENKQFSHLKRLSKPGVRRYVKSTDIPRPKSGFGLIIISTPKGMLTGSQARKQKVGGELVCEVW